MADGAATGEAVGAADGSATGEAIGAADGKATRTVTGEGVGLGGAEGGHADMTLSGQG